jgi:hypothetical protein
MGAVAGAVTVGVLLIAEDLLITGNGPNAVGGIFGTLSKAISDIASPNVAAVPNRAASKGKT